MFERVSGTIIYRNNRDMMMVDVSADKKNIFIYFFIFAWRIIALARSFVVCATALAGRSLFSIYFLFYIFQRNWNNRKIIIFNSFFIFLYRQCPLKLNTLDFIANRMRKKWEENLYSSLNFYLFGTITRARGGENRRGSAYCHNSEYNRAGKPLNR